MSRSGSKSLPSFGTVMLLVVMAIVLLLVAKRWQTVAPVVMDVNKTGQTGTIPAHGQTEAAQEIRSGKLPRMNEMKARTSDHGNQVKDALQTDE